jgi:hypothetical protein
MSWKFLTDTIAIDRMTSRDVIPRFSRLDRQATQARPARGRVRDRRTSRSGGGDRRSGERISR